MAESKIPMSPFATKSVSDSMTVAANSINTMRLSAPDAKYQIVKGFRISNTGDVPVLQVYFEDSTNIIVRVRNVTSGAQSTDVTVWYC